MSIVRLVFILFSVTVLQACTLGNGMICTPMMPQIDCKHDVYQRLTHPVPSRDEWDMPNVSTQNRGQDWDRCGGDKDGWYRTVTGKDALTKENIEKSSEMSHATQRCMLKKGYHYTGSCDSSVMRVSPACGAR